MTYGKHRKLRFRKPGLMVATGAMALSPLMLTVHTGDTLSGIAASHGKSLSAVEAANPQIKNPDLIYAGQKVALPGSGAVAHRAPGGGKVWGVTYGYPYKCGDGDGDGWDTPCSALHPAAPAQQPSGPSHAVSALPARHHFTPSHVSAPAGAGSYQQCVIRRESGGNPHAVNASSGAGGLYQFLPSTWRGLGYSGSPQDASVATQNQAFQRLYAQAGHSPWSPSDGC